MLGITRLMITQDDIDLINEVGLNYNLLKKSILKLNENEFFIFVPNSVNILPNSCSGISNSNIVLL